VNINTKKGYKMTVDTSKVIRETVSKFATLLDGNQFRRELSDKQRLKAIDFGLIVVYGTLGGKFYLDGYLSQEINSLKDKKIWFNRENEYKGKRGRDQYGHTPDSKCDNYLEVRMFHYLYDCDLGFHSDVPSQSFRILKNSKIYCMGLVMHVDDLK